MATAIAWIHVSTSSLREATSSRPAHRTSTTHAPARMLQHADTQHLATNLIATDDEELIFVNTVTKCGGYDMPREEPDQERFKHIAAVHLAEAESEGLTSICYDIVSLLVTDSEKAFLRHHKNVLNDRR